MTLKGPCVDLSAIFGGWHRAQEGVVASATWLAANGQFDLGETVSPAGRCPRYGILCLPMGWKGEGL